MNFKDNQPVNCRLLNCVGFLSQKCNLNYYAFGINVSGGHLLSIWYRRLFTEIAITRCTIVSYLHSSIAVTASATFLARNWAAIS